MKRKKRSPEERKADRERFEARQAELQGHIERIKAELEAKRKSA
jgi:uncharacterized small protein (DUF1192 family)